MKNFQALLLLALALLFALPAVAQRKVELNSQADVDQAVAQALVHAKAEGELARLAAEPGLAGSFTVDITVDDKGRTETVFMVESTIPSVPARNRVKECLTAIRYDFKVPKDKRFKTRQTLAFP